MSDALYACAKCRNNFRWSQMSLGVCSQCISKKEQKSTPGPWKVGAYQDYIFSDDGMVCEMRGIGGNLPIAANARLIAAAPEMYEALRDIAAFLEAGDTSSIADMHGDISELLTRIDGGGNERD